MKLKDSGMTIGGQGYCLLKSHPKEQHTIDLDCWQALRHYLYNGEKDDFDAYKKACRSK